MVIEKYSCPSYVSRIRVSRRANQTSSSSHVVPPFDYNIIVREGLAFKTLTKKQLNKAPAQY